MVSKGVCLLYFPPFSAPHLFTQLREKLTFLAPVAIPLQTDFNKKRLQMRTFFRFYADYGGRFNADIFGFTALDFT
jgi:hypothetical protein